MRYYNFCLLKSYFDKGYGITTYPKYILVMLGIATAVQGTSLLYLFIGGLIYGLLCFFIGYMWYKLGFMIAEAEVGNQFNLFQKEMRKKINGKI